MNIRNITINYLLDLYSSNDKELVNIFWVSIIESILANFNKEDIYYLLDELPKYLKAEIIEFNNYILTTKL